MCKNYWSLSTKLVNVDVTVGASVGAGVRPAVGVTVGVSLSVLDFTESLGLRARALVGGSWTLVDGLMEVA